MSSWRACRPNRHLESFNSLNISQNIVPAVLTAFFLTRIKPEVAQIGSRTPGGGARSCQTATMETYMAATKLLFVDDESAIRMTLAAILEGEGFEVKTAASVREAVELINKEAFDVLISDLNIGQPGDGFTVVSVMRRIQPDAVTFILTGYPDFESALRAIRSQVDDYLTKPADIPSLVAALKYKLENRRPIRQVIARRAPELILENLPELLQGWLVAVSKDVQLKKVSLDAKERIDNFPEILAGVCGQLINGSDGLDEATAAY